MWSSSAPPTAVCIGCPGVAQDNDSEIAVVDWAADVDIQVYPQESHYCAPRPFEIPVPKAFRSAAAFATRRASYEDWLSQYDERAWPDEDSSGCPMVWLDGTAHRAHSPPPRASTTAWCTFSKLPFRIPEQFGKGESISLRSLCEACFKQFLLCS